MIDDFPVGVSPSDLFGPGSIYLPMLKAMQAYIDSMWWWSYIQTNSSHIKNMKDKMHLLRMLLSSMAHQNNTMTHYTVCLPSNNTTTHYTVCLSLSSGATGDCELCLLSRIVRKHYSSYDIARERSMFRVWWMVSAKWNTYGFSICELQPKSW